MFLERLFEQTFNEAPGFLSHQQQLQGNFSWFLQAHSLIMPWFSGRAKILNMKEELETLVLSGKISKQHVEPLLQLFNQGYCVHRSWGVGKIGQLDTVFGRLSVDFQGRPGHTMDLGFAADSLKPIPGSHILAKKVSDLPTLRQMAAVNHLELIKMVLQSFG